MFKKILLHIIKNRITPIVEASISESQLGFRSGRGTRNGLFILRTINERMIERQKKYIFVS